MQALDTTLAWTDCLANVFYQLYANKSTTLKQLLAMRCVSKHWKSTLEKHWKVVIGSREKWRKGRVTVTSAAMHDLIDRFQKNNPKKACLAGKLFVGFVHDHYCYVTKEQWQTVVETFQKNMQTHKYNWELGFGPTEAMQAIFSVPEIAVAMFNHTYLRFVSVKFKAPDTRTGTSKYIIHYDFLEDKTAFSADWHSFFESRLMDVKHCIQGPYLVAKRRYTETRDTYKVAKAKYNDLDGQLKRILAAQSTLRNNNEQRVGQASDSG